jgi:hypothetical protein
MNYFTIKNKKKIPISCAEMKLGFNDFVVVSCYKDIMTLVRSFENQSRKTLESMFTKVHLRMFKYSKKEVEEFFHHQENNNYRIWCTNVLIWYVIRFILYNESIPLVQPFCQNCKTKDEQHTFKKCGRCRTYYYCSKECQLKNWSHHKQFCKM